MLISTASTFKLSSCHHSKSETSTGNNLINSHLVSLSINKEVPHDISLHLKMMGPDEISVTDDSNSDQQDDKNRGDCGDKGDCSEREDQDRGNRLSHSYDSDDSEFSPCQINTLQ